MIRFKQIKKMNKYYQILSSPTPHTLFFLSIAEKLLVVLRDGRTLIGYLRTIDQFGKYAKLFVAKWDT